MKNFLTSVIDFFYPPFRRFIPLRTFRYAACGGGNTLLGFIIYTISYKFIFAAQMLDLGFFAFKPHVASLILSFLVNFPVGFLLMKYVVFVESNLRGAVQLMRYFFVFVSNLFLNYFLLKVLVDYLDMNAIWAQGIATAIVIGTSYLLQQHFSFRVQTPRTAEESAGQ